jgi:hypothetical protein
MDRFVPDLRRAPDAPIDSAGQPLHGRFAGRCTQIDWRRLPPALRRTAWWRRFHHKRWQYVGIAAKSCFIGCAIVDVGWTSAAFAYLFDRRQRKVVGGLSRDGLPGLTASLAAVPQPGSASRFAWQGATLRFEALDAGGYALKVASRDDFSIDVTLAESAGEWLFATGPVEGGAWHATHKSPAMAVRGHARAGGQVYSLDGAWASLDHSNGLLARDTCWRWASAHGPGIGFNLQAGYFGENENALWLDGRLVALGAAHFEFDPANTLGPWRIHTADGLLDLIFTPEGERREDRNLIVAASRYVQPVGTFAGRVRTSPDAAWHEVVDLVGVVEDHFSRW